MPATAPRAAVIVWPLPQSRGYAAEAACRHGEHGVAAFACLGRCTPEGAAAVARRAHGAEYRCGCAWDAPAAWPDGQPLAGAAWP
jgi:hypothetical protein